MSTKSMNRLPKPINFEPDPVTPHKPSDTKSKTGTVISLLTKKDGTTLKELSSRLTKVGGAAVDERSARNWVSRSFLAPMGYGVKTVIKRSASGRESMRLKGYRYTGKRKTSNNGAAAE